MRRTNTRKALYGDVRNGREMVARAPATKEVNGPLNGKWAELAAYDAQRNG